MTGAGNHFQITPTGDALTDSMRRQALVSALGFDWPSIDGVFDKIAEELEEIRAAFRAGRTEAAGAELGDLLVAAVNAARFLNVDPAKTLEKATDKLCRRVEQACKLIEKEGCELQSCAPCELDAVWNRVKMLEDKGLNNTP